MDMEAKPQLEITRKQGPIRQHLSRRVIAFVVFLGILICTVVILQFCFKRSERANKVRKSSDSKSTMTPPCSGECTITLVESIPENLKFAAGSVRHQTIYDGWMRLLKVAEKSIDIASFYWTLRGVDTNTSDPSTQQGEDVFQGLRAAGKRGQDLAIANSICLLLRCKYPSSGAVRPFSGCLLISQTNREKIKGRNTSFSMRYQCTRATTITKRSPTGVLLAKFPHSPILNYTCRLLLTENNGKNNTTRCGTLRCFCCFLVAKQRTTHIESHA